MGQSKWSWWRKLAEFSFLGCLNVETQIDTSEMYWLDIIKQIYDACVWICNTAAEWTREFVAIAFIIYLVLMTNLKNAEILSLNNNGSKLDSIQIVYN